MALNDSFNMSCLVPEVSLVSEVGSADSMGLWENEDRDKATLEHGSSCLNIPGCVQRSLQQLQNGM